MVERPSLLRRIKGRAICWMWDKTGATAAMDHYEEQYLRYNVELHELKLAIAQKAYGRYKWSGLESAPEEDKAAEDLHWAQSDLDDARVALEIFLGR